MIAYLMEAARKFLFYYLNREKRVVKHLVLLHCFLLRTTDLEN